MTMTSKAFLFAVLLGITAAQPIAQASAAAPDAITNQTVDDPPKGSAGIYDNYDQFKDSSGRPLQGYGYLWAVPGS